VLTLRLLPPVVVGELCSFALEYLRSGMNQKKVAGAASTCLMSCCLVVVTVAPNHVLGPQCLESLGMNPEDLEHGVMGITFLYVECAKAKVRSEADFTLCLTDLALQPAQLQAIWNRYETHLQLLDSLRNSSLHTHKFKSMKWRMDVKLGSRSAPKAGLADLRFLMEISAIKGGDEQQQLMEMDYGTLCAFSKEVSNALEASAAHKTRRMVRHLSNSSR